MASSTIFAAAPRTNVGMGQMAVGKGASQFTSVLGSCVGVALYHARTSTGAFSHVVLPESKGHQGGLGKFADTAIPRMISELQAAGAVGTRLVAKITGGSRMFGEDGPMQIGRANIQAVEAALSLAGVKILAKEVGGNKGRRVTFCCDTGDLSIETVGNPCRVL